MTSMSKCKYCGGSWCGGACVFISTVVLVAVTALGCASAQDKLEDARSKTDEVLAKIDCVADAVKPYEKHLSKAQLSKVLTGELDPVETLKALEVTPKDVATMAEALKACK